MVWMRHNAPCNRYVTGERLRLLFPKLKKEKVEILIGALLKTEQLEPASFGWNDVGEAWTITDESLTCYENKILRKREEVRKKLVNEILKKINEEVLPKLNKIEKDLEELRVEVGGAKEEIRELKEQEKKPY